MPRPQEILGLILKSVGEGYNKGYLPISEYNTETAFRDKQVADALTRRGEDVAYRESESNRRAAEWAKSFAQDKEQAEQTRKFQLGLKMLGVHEGAREALQKEKQTKADFDREAALARELAGMKQEPKEGTGIPTILQLLGTIPKTKRVGWDEIDLTPDERLNQAIILQNAIKKHLAGGQGDGQQTGPLFQKWPGPVGNVTRPSGGIDLSKMTDEELQRIINGQ